MFNINMILKDPSTQEIKVEETIKFNVQTIEKRSLVVSNDIGKYRDALTESERTMYPNAYHMMLKASNDLQLWAYRMFFWAHVFLRENRKSLGEEEKTVLVQSLRDINKHYGELTNYQKLNGERENIPENIYAAGNMKDINDIRSAVSTIMSLTND